MRSFMRRLFGQSTASPADEEAWRQKIESLSDRAFELAVARWQSGEPLDEATTAETRQLQSELRELAQELSEDHPDVYQTFSSTISEALLDFKYALDAPPATSLRLHHYIESQENG